MDRSNLLLHQGFFLRIRRRDALNVLLPLVFPFSSSNLKGRVFHSSEFAARRLLSRTQRIRVLAGTTDPGHEDSDEEADGQRDQGRGHRGKGEAGLGVGQVVFVVVVVGSGGVAGSGSRCVVQGVMKG